MTNTAFNPGRYTINNWYDWLNDCVEYNLSFGHFAAYLEGINDDEELDGSSY